MQAGTVATVDLMDVVKKLPSYEKFEADLQKEVTIATNKLQTKKEQLEAKINEIETKSESMSQQRLTRLRREVSSMRREMSFMEEDLQNNLGAVEQDMKATLVREAQAKIQQYAQNNNIDFIVSHDMTIFSAHSIDVTKQVIESLS